MGSDQELVMKQHCIDGFPLEACGLFLGPLDSKLKPTGQILKVWPAVNAQASARIYSVDSKDMFEASKYATENGLEIVGVFHSHTHTPAYPSSTDVEQSVDKSWCYAIVSLMDEELTANYFQMENEQVIEVDCEIS